MTDESLSHDNLDEARSLIDALLDGRLSAESAERLQTLVCRESRVRALYVRVMHQECVIAAHASTVQLDFDETLRQSEAAGVAESSRLTTLHGAIREARKIERSELDTNSAMEPGSRVDPGSTLHGLPAGLPEDGEEDISAGIEAPPMIIQPRAAKARRGIRPTRLAAAILLVAGSALVIVLYQLGILGGNSPQPIAMGPSLDAIWSQPGSVAPAGNLIKTGVPQSLASGYAELTSPNGLVVIIQGPATFTVEKAGVLSLASGKLTASVPKPARGFTVNTPVSRIVDLGTEFGVSVDASGQTDVQTFRGTVSLTAAASPPSAPAKLISAGVARRVNSFGDVTEIPANTTTFVRPQQFADWNATHTAGYESWRAYSERLSHDPGLIAYYTFDKAAQTPDRLLNQSSLGVALDGVLTSDKPGAQPAWTTGRWPQKGALEFSGKDGSRVVVPSGIGDPLDFSRGLQTASPLTIAAWIRPEAAGNCSIAAKGYALSEQFALDTARGWIRQVPIIVRAREAVTTPPGIWSQLVLTYDPIQRNTRLYRNGVLIVHEEGSPAQLLEANTPMTIGCRLDQQPGESAKPVHYISAFHGRIDELLIMKRAMSADEVREMYRMEKPAE